MPAAGTFLRGKSLATKAAACSNPAAHRCNGWPPAPNTGIRMPFGISARCRHGPWPLLAGRSSQRPRSRPRPGQPWRKTRSRQGAAGSLPRQTWLAWVWCRAGGVRGAPGGRRRRDDDRDRGQRAAGHRQHCRDQRSLQRAKQRHRRGEQCSVGTRPDDAAELRACRTECSGCRKFARAVAPACRSGEHLPVTACCSTCGRTPVGTMWTFTCFLASLGTERPSNIACNRINH